MADLVFQDTPAAGPPWDLVLGDDAGSVDARVALNAALPGLVASLAAESQEPGSGGEATIVPFVTDWCSANIAVSSLTEYPAGIESEWFAGRDQGSWGDDDGAFMGELALTGVTSPAPVMSSEGGFGVIVGGSFYRSLFVANAEIDRFFWYQDVELTGIKSWALVFHPPGVDCFTQSSFSNSDGSNNFLFAGLVRAYSGTDALVNFAISAGIDGSVDAYIGSQVAGLRVLMVEFTDDAMTKVVEVGALQAGEAVRLQVPMTYGSEQVPQDAEVALAATLARMTFSARAASPDAVAALQGQLPSLTVDISVDAAVDASLAVSLAASLPGLVVAITGSSTAGTVDPPADDQPGKSWTFASGTQFNVRSDIGANRLTIDGMVRVDSGLLLAYASSIYASFWNSEQGRSIDYPGGLLFTSSDGVTWDQQVDQPMDRSLLKIVSNGEGILYAQKYAETGAASDYVLWKSTDAGVTWQALEVPGFNASGQTFVFATGQKVAVVTMSFDAVISMVSADAGATWNGSLVNLPEGMTQPWSAHFDGNGVVVCRYSGYGMVGDAYIELVRHAVFDDVFQASPAQWSDIVDCGAATYGICWTDDGAAHIVGRGYGDNALVYGAWVSYDNGRTWALGGLQPFGNSSTGESTGRGFALDDRLLAIFPEYYSASTRRIAYTENSGAEWADAEISGQASAINVNFSITPMPVLRLSTAQSTEKAITVWPSGGILQTEWTPAVVIVPDYFWVQKVGASEQLSQG